VPAITKQEEAKMDFTLDREFIAVSAELVKNMRAAGYSPSAILEVLIAAIIIVTRESEFSGDIEQAAGIIQRSIISMDPCIRAVRAN
jgi:hypothetical protein